MKIPSIICLLSVPYVSATTRKATDERLLFRSLRPDDMGTLHNEIVMQVHDRLLESAPKDHNEYSQIIYEEVITTCEDADDACRERIWQYIEKGRVEVKELMEAGDSFHVHSYVHDDLDDDLKVPLHEILDAVRLLHDHPLDHVLDTLSKISDKMESNNDSHSFNKDVVQMVTSIASGSALLWSEIDDNPHSAFHKLYTNGKKRNLQTVTTEVIQQSFGVSSATRIVGFVLSDTIGAIKGLAIPAVFFLSGLGEPTLAVESAVQQAMVDSLLAIGIKLPTFQDILLCVLGISISSCEFYNF